jgi:two-component system, NtrC family, sensor histidine kinase HydH
MKTKTRLWLRVTAPSVAISLLLLAAGGLAGAYIHRLNSDTSERLTKDVERINVAEELTLGVRDMRYQLNQFAITGDLSHLNPMESMYRSIREWLDSAESLASDGRDRELVVRVRAGYERFWKEFEALRKQPKAEARLAIGKLSNEMVNRTMVAPAQEFLDHAEHQVNLTGEQNLVLADRLAMAMVLLGVCGSVAGLVGGFGLARAVTRSMVELHVPIRDLRGKLAEVVGPIQVPANLGIDELDSELRLAAQRVALVVERLQQSQIELIRADQLARLGQLAAGLAHELRNPLASVKILVQSARESRGGGRLEGRDLEILEEEISRMERAIQRFLDYARPPKLERSLTDLGQLASQTWELVSARAERHGVALRYKPPAEPVRIEADPQQIRQVLLNLFLNAFDSIQDQGWISLSVEGAADEATARLSVADSGPGLPADLGQRIFEPFISNKETGLGLGLPICRRIIEAHGGQITAENAPEGGAVFHIVLPAKAAASLPLADIQR